MVPISSLSTSCDTIIRMSCNAGLQLKQIVPQYHLCSDLDCSFAMSAFYFVKFSCCSKDVTAFKEIRLLIAQRTLTPSGWFDNTICEIKWNCLRDYNSDLSLQLCAMRVLKPIVVRTNLASWTWIVIIDRLVDLRSYFAYLLIYHIVSSKVANRCYTARNKQKRTPRPTDGQQ